MSASKGWNGLSVTQLSALRRMCEGDIMYESDRQPAKRTGDSLIKKGYLKMTEGRYALTSYGERTIKGYVSNSGDGPEGLKSFFRF